MRLIAQLILGSLLAAATLLDPAQSYAQTARNEIPSEEAPIVTLSPSQKRKLEANKNVLGVVTGSLTGTYVRIGADLDRVISEDDMRIVTMLGRGSQQNIHDLLYLRGVDIAVVQGDVLNFLKQSPEFRRLPDKIRYVVKLYNEEIHLLTRTSIQNIQDLAGKTVNFGGKKSGTYMTASTIFNKIGVKVKISNFGQRKALEMLKRGEISAMVYVVGKPASVVKSIPAGENVKILPIPYLPAVQDIYLPSSFSSQDYPNVIAEGQRVPTLATTAVMAVYNWPKKTTRYQLLERFIKKFFANAEKFNAPSRHPKWKELSLTAVVPGWKRFTAAEKALKIMKDSEPKSDIPSRESFERFLRERKILLQNKLNDSQKKELFNAFMEWSKEGNR